MRVMSSDVLTITAELKGSTDHWARVLRPKGLLVTEFVRVECFADVEEIVDKALARKKLSLKISFAEFVTMFFDALNGRNPQLLLDLVNLADMKNAQNRERLANSLSLILDYNLTPDTLSVVQRFPRFPSIAFLLQSPVPPGAVLPIQLSAWPCCTK